MGGCNHQPCREYLAYSTEVSKCLSQAHADLQLANVALEDVLLTELGGGTGKVQSILTWLTKSYAGIQKAKEAFAALRKKMTDLEYADLPPLQTIPLKRLGEELVSDGLVAAHAWSVIEQQTRAGGYWATSAHLMNGLVQLAAYTQKLQHEFEGLEAICLAGELNYVLEENLPGNIKKTFAQLYTVWGTYQAEFLASAMLSTHIWYIWTERETLVNVANLRVVGAV